METLTLSERKALIAKLAKQHRAERSFVRSTRHANHTNDRAEYNALVKSTFEQLKRSSVKAPE